MSAYALQTKTMLRSVSNTPLQLLGLAAKRDEPKSQLLLKRKKDTICGLGAFNKPFTIKPYPDSPYDKPATFEPVRVIGRSQLPLTSLDTTPDENFAANCLFIAHIDILEDDGDSRGKDEGSPRILIARYDMTRTLYAIEGVQAHVYSICRLASWLKEKDVADLWDPSKLQNSPALSRVESSTAAAGVWWQRAVVEPMHSERPVKRPKMTMMQHTPQPETIPQELNKTPAPPEQAGLGTTPVDIPQEPLIESPSPQEQLSSLVQQYLDAVYMSKTSLAYLAKGPIARIRNAFTSPKEGAPPTYELVTFLRSMLLSPKASEKKYYEKLPLFIKAMPPGSLSDEEQINEAGKVRKFKKKTKLSRDGTYPREDMVIKKWWMSELPNGESMGAETIEHRIKRRIGDLRVRETLAQMILMLEIIALEALSAYKPALEDQPDLDQSHVPDETQIKPKKRKRKLDDINLQLDLLLDKLCIWHATEEMGIMDFDVKPSRQHGATDGMSRNGTHDRLHSFCVEVVIPFYMNRLPEKALLVNKKLGGPAHASPPKRKAMKPPLTARKSGEPKEPEAKKSRRSLARVATDSTGTMAERVTPSLTRSMTDSALLNGVKREGSEVPLSAIPFQRSPSQSARQSMSQMRHLQGRQIDLTQSAAASAKLKHKQRVEEDLYEAILALKKPNRGLAAGGYVAEIEQRGLGLPNKSRKAANPVRKMVKDIQVSATPRIARRTKNMIEQTRSHRQSNPFLGLPGTEAPSCSDFCIPSSGTRPQSFMVPGTVKGSAAARRQGHSSIAETPSKAPNCKTFSSGAVRRSIFATPSKASSSSSDSWVAAPSAVFETRAKPLSSPPTNADLTAPAVGGTPTKFPPPVSGGETAPTLFDMSSRTDMEGSIYDALGWNDDDGDVV